MAKSKSKAPKLSQHDAAARKYRRSGADNAATKQARKVAANQKK